MLEDLLLNSAIDSTLTNEEILRDIQRLGVSTEMVRGRLQLERHLRVEADRVAPEVRRLSAERERIAEIIREVLDPERPYYLGLKRRPQHFDLIGDVLNPAILFLAVAPIDFLWDITVNRSKAVRRLLRTACLSLVVVGLILGMVLALRRNARHTLLAIASAGILLVFLYAVGMIMRLRRYSAARKHLTFEQWFERRTSTDFEMQLQGIVDKDPDYMEALEKERTSRDLAESQLVANHVLPAARRVLAELATSPKPEALAAPSESTERRPSKEGSDRNPPRSNTRPAATAEDKRVRKAGSSTTGQAPIVRSAAPKLDGVDEARLRPELKAFISYVHEDSEQVDKLEVALQANDIAVWRDKSSLDPGTWWKEEIRRQIETGLFFIACFSENSETKARSYMREELLFAVQEIGRRPRDRAWFLPVLFSDVVAPALPISAQETLQDIQTVSLYRNWEAGLDRLLRVMESTLSKRIEAQP